MNSNEMIWIDLPSLQSITLGWYALEGKNDDSCSLTMRSNNEMIRNDQIVDLPNLTSIDSRGISFSNPRSVTLESIYKCWILILFRYSKSSKCQAIWFIPESQIKNNFVYCLIDLISFIDVSPILADLTKIKQ